MCLCPCVIVSGRRILRRGVCVGGRFLVGRVVMVVGVSFGIVLSLGICPKFTPAPHFPASVGVMREEESERNSRV